MSFTDSDYEQLAIKAIISYKNKDYTDDEVKALYPLAISLVINNIKKSLVVDKNYSQVTQGSRSITYNKENSVIDDTVKMILGVPYARLY